MQLIYRQSRRITLLATSEGQSEKWFIMFQVARIEVDQSRHLTRQMFTNIHKCSHGSAFRLTHVGSDDSSMPL